MAHSTEPGTDPLASWTGDFGKAYMGRNEVNPEKAQEAAAVFERIFDRAGVRTEVKSVLEVGANIGINLFGIRGALGPDVRLGAIEPNPVACETLRSAQDALRLSELHQATAYDIPIEAGAYDLVFTNGVLIHIPPDRLPEATSEIHRVSSRYILCSEYFSHSPASIRYHGQDDLLWKEDFGKRYLQSFPDLRVVDYGFTWQEEFPHFDNLNWWLFEKTGSDSGEPFDRFND